MSYFIERTDISGVSKANKANAAMQFQSGEINSARVGQEQYWGDWLSEDLEVFMLAPELVYE